MVTGIGFQPNYVAVFQEGAACPVSSSSAMNVDESYDFDDLRLTNRIQQFLTDGFEVGGNAEVNTLNVTYHYVAWKAVAGRVAVDKYIGTGVDNKDWNVTGFMPEWVLVKRADPFLEGGSTSRPRPG